MTWLAGHSWLLLLLAALLGFGLTWWWMVRKVRGKVLETRTVTTGAAAAVGGTVAAGAATLAASAPTPSVDVPEVAVDVPEVAVDVPEVAVDVPEVAVDVPEVAVDVPEVSAAAPFAEAGAAAAPVADESATSVDAVDDLDASADAPVAAADAETAIGEATEVVIPDAATELEASEVEESDGNGSAAGLVGAAAGGVYAVGAFGEGSVDPLSDGSMPVGFDVKGNADSMLYHSPESPWYGRTKAEVWFRDEETAAAAGFARWDSRGRSARAGDGEAAALVAPVYAVGAFGEGSVDPLSDGSMPVGFDVKGNADSMLYHSPESPWYGRTKAEVWFRDEETAAAAGFARWDSRGRSARAGDGEAAALVAPVYAVGAFGEGSVDPLSDGSMPVGFDVKGNADSMLYHSPESPWYGRTKAEVWFRDEETAAAAGFARWDSRGRSARAGDGEAAALVAPVYAVGAFGEGSVDPLSDGSMPVGFDVKGNADSMLYHSPESPWYGRTKAEVWFRDEETAAAAGFARWDSRGRSARAGDGAGEAAALVAPVYAVGAFGEGSVDPLSDGSMPVGFDVKGNADSMLYHSPESPWYGRTKAEVWFRDEETAAAAGFKHWDPAKR